MLIGAVDPPGREIVHLLARRPDQVHTGEQVASSIQPQAPEALTDTIHARIKRINQFADAFERMPMIDIHDEGYLMTASVAEVVLDALSDPRS
jgi:DNA-binding response OmpR family regulator